MSTIGCSCHRCYEYHNQVINGRKKKAEKPAKLPDEVYGLPERNQDRPVVQG